MQAVTLQSVTKISPGHIAAMREFMKGVPNGESSLTSERRTPSSSFSLRQGRGFSWSAPEN
jgi:hypothetical protein